MLSLLCSLLNGLNYSALWARACACMCTHASMGTAGLLVPLIRGRPVHMNACIVGSCVFRAVACVWFWVCVCGGLNRGIGDYSVSMWNCTSQDHWVNSSKSGTKLFVRVMWCLPAIVPEKEIKSNVVWCVCVCVCCRGKRCFMSWHVYKKLNSLGSSDQNQTLKYACKHVSLTEIVQIWASQPRNDTYQITPANKCSTTPKWSNFFFIFWWKQ